MGVGGGCVKRTGRQDPGETHVRRVSRGNGVEGFLRPTGHPALKPERRVSAPLGMARVVRVCNHFRLAVAEFALDDGKAAQAIGVDSRRKDGDQGHMSQQDGKLGRCGGKRIE